MVTMGLVAALACLSLTALNRALDISKSVKCVSQLKAVYTGFQLYLQDNRGSFPPANPQPPENAAWNIKWQGPWYAPTVSPDEGLPRYFAGGNSGLAKLVVCPVNNVKLPAATGSNQIFHYVCNYEVMTQQGFPRAPARIINFRASEAVLLVDSAVGMDWGFGIPANNVNLTAWKRVAERHRDQLNILWADGHVTSAKKASLTQDDFALKGL